MSPSAESCLPSRPSLHTVLTPRMPWPRTTSWAAPGPFLPGHHPREQPRWKAQLLDLTLSSELRSQRAGRNHSCQHSKNTDPNTFITHIAIPTPSVPKQPESTSETPQVSKPARSLRLHDCGGLFHRGLEIWEEQESLMDSAFF